MTLSEIQAEIKKDSQLDKNHLDRESISISSLHAKWLTILAGESKLFRAIKSEHDKLVLDLTLYYMGKASDEVYKEKPLQHKVLKQELQTWLDADDDYIASKTKLEDTELKLTMIDSFMNELKQRSFNIRNAIEFEKFKAGGF